MKPSRPPADILSEGYARRACSRRASRRLGVPQGTPLAAHLVRPSCRSCLSHAQASRRATATRPAGVTLWAYALGLLHAGAAAFYDERRALADGGLRVLYVLDRPVVGPVRLPVEGAGDVAPLDSFEPLRWGCTATRLSNVSALPGAMPPLLIAVPANSTPTVGESFRSKSSLRSLTRFLCESPVRTTALGTFASWRKRIKPVALRRVAVPGVGREPRRWR